MSGTSETTVTPLDKKRGYPIYDRNPSVAHPNAIASKRKPFKVANGNRVMIVGRDTGEVMGDGHAAFFEMKEVDETQFIKLYLAGIKQTAKLTAAGLKVFELMYYQMRDNPQSDKIELNIYHVKKHGLDMTERTYQRGNARNVRASIPFSVNECGRLLRKRELCLQWQPHNLGEKLLPQGKRGSAARA